MNNSGDHTAEQRGCLKCKVVRSETTREPCIFPAEVMTPTAPSPKFLKPNSQAFFDITSAPIHRKMKTKPSKQAKRRQKTVLNGTNGTVKKPKENPETLLLRATTLLQQSQPEEALQNALRGLKYLQRQTSAPDSKDVLDAMLLVAEIYLELGDMENAREHFSKAVEFDPEGRAGSEAYLWMAQLSEEGGPDSIRWFEEALKILRREVGELEGQQSPEAQVLAAEKKVKMADALCSMTEIYMTDLS